ncbi:MAG: hypothetical protein FWE35_00955 [Streptosporangiales bacterium]|nr:hypothetical protein [Streptosporangiales bacterium]
MRVSPDGGHTYPRKGEEKLSSTPPLLPATISVYNHDAGTGRLVGADLDVARARAAGEPDPAAAVARQAGDLAAIVEKLGGRAVVDKSPNGGRHVYVLLAQPQPWRELKALAKAMSRRYSALDTGPWNGIRGQLRPPGARHKSGGCQQLVTPLDDARAAVKHPAGPGVWAGLLEEFAAELAAADPVRDLDDVPEGCERDAGGHPWLPRPDGRQPLRPDLEQIARNGIKGTRWKDRSRARMAVIASAALRGWTLTELQAQIAGGEWAGLAGLYARSREPGRMKRLLAGEWRKAITDLAGDSHLSNWHTSDSHTPRPLPPGGGYGTDDGEASGYGLIRMWATVIDIATADPARQKRWGRQAVAIRMVLLAMAQAAMISGSPVIEFGGRNLALYSGLPHRTAARAIETLRDEEDPLIDLVSRHHLDRADRYVLCVPEGYKTQAAWRRRRAGRIEALHHVWSVLGGTAAFTWLALDDDPQPASGVAADAHLSESAAGRALKLLAEYGLAEHGPRGWTRGPARLDDVAKETGATALQREREAAYGEHRDDWHRKIASWQPPPERTIPEDPDPPLPLAARLAELEQRIPPDDEEAWYAADPGPPATAPA